jgi:hypothetical protein
MYQTLFDNVYYALNTEFSAPLSDLTNDLPKEAHDIGHDLLPVREVQFSVDTLLRRNSRIIWEYEHDLLYVAKHESKSAANR